MKLIFIACVACVMTVRADVIIDGVPHRTQILYKNISNPHSLRIDDILNILYFLEKKDDGDDVVGKLYLNTSEIKYIEESSGANDITIDQVTQTVYIGTFNGLCKYNPSNNEVELVGLAGVNVWNAYFRGALYYTDGLSTVYTFSDEQSTEYVQLDDNVDRLLIYNEDITYFSYNKMVYRQNKGEKAVVLYNEEFNLDFIMDNRGKVYFCTKNAIYQILNDRDTVRKVVSLENLSGMTFDINNNIIYSDINNIYKLNPVNETQINNSAVSIENYSNILLQFFAFYCIFYSPDYV